MHKADKINIFLEEYESPLGVLLVGSFQDRLCLCDWKYRKSRATIDRRIQSGTGSEYNFGTTDITQEAILQLKAFFAGERTEFDLPLLPLGTEFQMGVWRALLEVPYGETISYKTLSRRLGDHHAVRAVASANGANALSIVIPCHRVLGSQGELTGYAGGLDAKKSLLRLESRVSRKGQLVLF